jgi:hypothetical protein
MAMARMLGRLKASEIPKLGPGRHHDGGGLYLVVGKGNARSWIFRYFRDGKSHDFGLGPALALGLADARQRAFECKAALFRGSNPMKARQAERLERVLAVVKAMTFAQAAEQYIAGTRPAGVTRGTKPNGASRSPPMSSRVSASCRSWRSTRRW